MKIELYRTSRSKAEIIEAQYISGGPTTLIITDTDGEQITIDNYYSFIII